MELAWKFFIDVGGTFTDCIGVDPNGVQHTLKWLSSGVSKSTISSIRSPRTLFDESRVGDPRDFWRGYEFWIRQKDGSQIKRVVQQFDRETGCFELDQDIDFEETEEQFELFHPAASPVQSIRYLLGKSPNQDIDVPLELRLGTTRGTNALLTRSGARTAWVTTLGFADILEIGNQSRPDLFAIDIVKIRPLHECKIEIDERIAADGKVLRPVDVPSTVAALKEIKQRGLNSIAICLLHGDRYPQHERQVAKLAREAGFQQICCSHEVAPQIKLVERGNTTLVDAYLNPVLKQYVAEINDAVCAHQDSTLLLMNSAGGLVSHHEFTGKESVLSGPAGGVVGMSAVAQSCGFHKAIGFDMGGTSTDVARFDGEFELEYQSWKAGVPIMTPTLAIETVAAGGGSICTFDGFKLLVGPDSAGAEPGPACYGKGGPLTVTDVNLLLGRIDSSQFPFQLDRNASQSRAEEIIEQIHRSTGNRMTIQQLAFGFFRIANTAMAQAIRSVSVAKGFDAREFALLSFGGAAGQHACAISDELGIRNVIVHPESSLLSAHGMRLAKRRWHQSQGMELRLDQSNSRKILNAKFADLEKRCASRISEFNQVPFCIRKTVHARYHGTDYVIPISFDEQSTGHSFSKLKNNFELAHQRLFGFVQRDQRIVVSAIHCEILEPEEPSKLSQPIQQISATLPGRFLDVAIDGTTTRNTPVFRTAELRPGCKLDGPALITSENTVVFLESGWDARMLEGRELHLMKASDIGNTERPQAIQEKPTEVDPIMLEVMSQQLMAIATQMGHTLQRTSASVNVRERLDFSCAIFRNNGDLVANAPHVPVHLGAMGESVKHIIADNPVIRPGDVFVTNDPYRGGSHLPDVTVVTPVFLDSPHSEESAACFVACRAHHAEIGGIMPGSMPPFSKCLADEGILIQNFKLFDQGIEQYGSLRDLLTSGQFPSRSPGDNIRDVQAQVAANLQGAEQIKALSAKHSWAFVEYYLEAIQEAASQKMRRVLGSLPNQTSQFIDFLDDGSPIKVAFTVQDDKAIIDFTGSGPVLSSNLNANRSIVISATIYCLRLLINENIPLNQGVLEPVELVLPESLLNPGPSDDPQQSPAIVGGNVETSQRIVDTVLGAFGICAASQGTMNNFLFGNESFGYYETICGGSGASSAGAGASAVHTHMTNTRITDPEILESRFPVRLHEFSIREDSGGQGVHRGGDGVIRRIEFLDRLDVSLLTQRRAEFCPYGIEGGQPGLAGKNILTRRNGQRETLDGAASLIAEVGDVIEIQTPGGGGFGAA